MVCPSPDLWRLLYQRTVERQTPRERQFAGRLMAGGKMKGLAYAPLVILGRSLLLLPFQVHKAIAHPALGEDVLRVGRVGFDFLAQVGDV